MNQDAVAWLPEGGEGSRVVVCLADGHGSESCFRSDTGARFAVETASRLGAAFAAGVDRPGSLTELERRASAEVFGPILEQWRSQVLADQEQRPFTDDELGGREITDRLVPYGATLVMAIAGQRRAVVIQLGDGDIVTVDATGEVIRPLPNDTGLVGGETTSLCLPDAAKHLRLRGLDLTQDPVELIVLATDGYGNSFGSEDWAEAVGRDLLVQMRTEGPSWIAKQLTQWTADSASVGGDDTTVGILARDVLPAQAKRTMRGRDRTPILAQVARARVESSRATEPNDRGEPPLQPSSAMTSPPPPRTTASPQRRAAEEVPSYTSTTAPRGFMATRVLTLISLALLGLVIGFVAGRWATDNGVPRDEASVVPLYLTARSGLIVRIEPAKSELSVIRGDVGEASVGGTAGDPRGIWFVRGTSVVLVDQRNGMRLEEVALNEPLGSIGAGGGAIWVVTADGAAVYRIDGSTKPATYKRLPTNLTPDLIPPVSESSPSTSTSRPRGAAGRAGGRLPA